MFRFLLFVTVVSLLVAQRFAQDVEQASLFTVWGTNKESQLIRAASSGEIDKVAFQLQNNANVNERDVTGLTAAIIAAQYGHYKIIEMVRNLVTQLSPWELEKCVS